MTRLSKKGLFCFGQLIEDESDWIEKVIRSTLRPVKGGRVCSLGVGKGIELLHLRNFVGDDGKIFAFDIIRDAYLEIMRVISDATFHIGDMRNIGSIMAVMEGHMPDIVVCRHPEIILYEGNGDPAIVQEDIMSALGRWGTKAYEAGAQMLITLKTRNEQDVLAKAMGGLGLPCALGANNFSPDYLNEIWGNKRQKIDSHTIKIG